MPELKAGSVSGEFHRRTFLLSGSRGRSKNTHENLHDTVFIILVNRMESSGLDRFLKLSPLKLNSPWLKMTPSYSVSVF